MYTLESGGRLIDTPGVRDFVPAIPDLRDIAHGFVEIGTTAATAALLIAVTCANRTAQSAPRSTRGASTAATLRKLPAADEPRQTGRRTGLLISADMGTRRDGVRQGAGIHILELATHRHAMRDARGANPAFPRNAGQIAGCGLALHRGAGGQNQFAQLCPQRAAAPAREYRVRPDRCHPAATAGPSARNSDRDSCLTPRSLPHRPEFQRRTRGHDRDARQHRSCTARLRQTSGSVHRDQPCRARPAARRRSAPLRPDHDRADEKPCAVRTLARRPASNAGRSTDPEEAAKMP